MNKHSSASLVLAGTVSLCAGFSAHAATPEVKIYETGNQRCIESNGVPNHAMGTFPNSGNPNQFAEQQLKFCFPLKPQKNSRITRNTPNVGIALNGIVIRPGTADWYDPNSPRGFSRDRSSGWNLEGMGSASNLGIDKSNAHVDNRGLYHYHGKPPKAASKGSLVGYAADGFEIHYIGNTAKPSYQLRPGKRASAPGGKHDGRFVQDWVFVTGSGNLDECNGAEMNGRYVYFATDAFPFFPRCHWGNVSADFQQRGQTRPERQPRQTGQRGGPLAAAAAELGISERQLAEAVGAPPPDIKRASKILGIPEAKLKQVMRKHRPR